MVALFIQTIMNLRDKIMGKEKAEQRERDIESLLDQLGIDSNLSRMRKHSD